MSLVVSLGLSQVYGVARQPGGTVRIDTKRGRGTTVTVSLLRTTAGAAANPLEAVTGPQGRRTGAILVVDDDPDVTVAALESLGYAVTAAESGRAALEIVERGVSVDLMLIDYAIRKPSSDIAGRSITIANLEN